MKSFIRRFLGLFVIDLVIWAGSIFTAQYLRFDFRVEQINIGSSVVLLAIVAILQFAAGWIFWLYRGRFLTGSIDEVRALFLSTASVSAVGTVGIMLSFGAINGLPRSTMVIAAPIAFTVMGAVRYVLRALLERQRKPENGTQRSIIFGGGYVGRLTIQRLLTDPLADFIPVAILDDDPAKRNLSVRGVRVTGGLADLESTARDFDASTIIVCIGFADSHLLRQVNDDAKRLGLRVLVLPPFDKVLEDSASISDIRDISIEDLIGRHPVRLDMSSIGDYISDARVLVTGAGGSIGSELCRQIFAMKPRELIMLDRDETGLQQTQIMIHGHGLLDTRDVVLADIRDAEALHKIFLERKPNVVFHAAALKHLPMLEQYPDEAWKTNVLGTQNVLEAAATAGVTTFVNISTDKAANPTSVLGHSKRVTEKLTAEMGDRTGNRYLSVRFGNVIGSRGSMLPTFASIIEDGGPLTITHRDVTRFFMTIPEACQLVIQAGAIGRSKEVLILDMGEPVRILDVAEEMIRKSGKDIQIIFTGLRPGEKLHEELVGTGEEDERPFHPKISHARVKPLKPADLSRDEWFTRL